MVVFGDYQRDDVNLLIEIWDADFEETDSDVDHDLVDVITVPYSELEAGDFAFEMENGTKIDFTLHGSYGM